MTHTLATLLLAATFLAPVTGHTHPGRTAKDGCHYCRTNCQKWGQVQGARHSHNGQTCDGKKSKSQSSNFTKLKAHVVGVSDGDTITVLTAAKESIKIRLYGIDTPERYQDFGTKAKEYTSEKLFNKDVEVEIIDTDRYGRKVALVKTNQNITHNEQVVKDGFAWVYDQYCKKDFCKEWKTLEANAKKNKSGLWSFKDPIAPWTFRRMKSSR